MNGLAPRGQREIGRAMAEQVARVNDRRPARSIDPDYVVGLEREIAALRDELARLKARDVDAKSTPDRSGALIMHGDRACFTAAQAAAAAGISLATVSRYCASGYWAHTVQPGTTNRLLIFADQPLMKKHKK